jgi:hypothetical protein
MPSLIRRCQLRKYGPRKNDSLDAQLCGKLCVLPSHWLWGFLGLSLLSGEEVNWKPSE